MGAWNLQTKNMQVQAEVMYIKWDLADCNNLYFSVNSKEIIVDEIWNDNI